MIGATSLHLLCIVPQLTAAEQRRHRSSSRRGPTASRGAARKITLLGQTVNRYKYDLWRRPRTVRLSGNLLSADPPTRPASSAYSSSPTSRADMSGRPYSTPSALCRMCDPTCTSPTVRMQRLLKRLLKRLERGGVLPRNVGALTRAACGQCRSAANSSWL